MVFLVSVVFAAARYSLIIGAVLFFLNFLAIDSFNFLLSGAGRHSGGQPVTKFI
jgi:hypothetical protein